VLEAMQSAVHREIGEMVATIPTGNDYLAWAASGKLQQAVVVADNIGFVRYTEAAIAAGELEALAEKVSAKLHLLVNMARDQSLKKLQRILVDNLIVRTQYQQNVVRKLIKNGCESWENVLRHYWEDGVKVRVGDKELEYGYEYIGSA